MHPSADYGKEYAISVGAIANLIFVEIQTAKFDNGR